MTKWYDQYYLEHGRYPTVADFDNKNREWLGVASKNLSRNLTYYGAEKKEEIIDTILGLSDSSSPEKATDGDCPNYMHGLSECGTVPKTKEDKKQPLPTSWDCCNYWTFGNYCGNCGTKRPQNKSLAEKFRDAVSLGNGNHIRIEYVDWDALAKLAEEHYRA